MNNSAFILNVSGDKYGVINKPTIPPGIADRQI